VARLEAATRARRGGARIQVVLYSSRSEHAKYLSEQTCRYPFIVLRPPRIQPLAQRLGEWRDGKMSSASRRWTSAGVLVGTSGLRFGDLVLCNFTALPVLNKMTVRQFLAVVNTLLGGGSGPVTIADSDPIAFALTRPCWA
jgi:hypothetical protein